MAGYVEGVDRSQATFLPDRLDDFVDANNPVRVVDAFVDALDLRGLGFVRAVPSSTGRPGYHTAVLLKLYVYGYLDRIPSSRRLEREAGRNVELMWLTGRLIPDHKTIGRKTVIWVSILGVLPFTLALPYASFSLTIALSLVIGFVLASAFSAIVVFAQSLMPDRIGMISGVFFGLLFGFGGLGAVLLGLLADWTSIEFVYKVCSFFPLMGLLNAFLPDTDRPTAWLKAVT